MKNNSPVIQLLRTPESVLVVLALALIAQIPHAADVFRMIPRHADWWSYAHSYVFAIALELAVLVFVVQNRQLESYAFAAVSIAMNLSYYYLNDIHLFSAVAFPSWLVSIALPAAIARYSHAVVGDTHSEQSEQKPAKRAQRAARATHADEHQEQYTIVQPVQLEANTDVQLPVVAEQSIDYTALNPEQKREHFAALFAQDDKLNRTVAAEMFGVSRTTLYGWIRELSAA